MYCNQVLKLEICATDIHSVLAAKNAHADRVELCSALEVGGLTPSEGLIRAAVSSGIAVHVLIRPRPGDFVYDEEEIMIMEHDVQRAVQMGAAGVVFGGLRDDGTVDQNLCRRLIAKAGNVEITFHRAIDRCVDIPAGVKNIVGMGFDRILTSGGMKTACEGAEMIKRMVEVAGGRLTIMAGSGVNSSNVRDLIERTGVRAVHASAKGDAAEMLSLRNIVSSVL